MTIDPFKIKRRNPEPLPGAPVLPYRVLTLEQGSIEWKRARLEHITSSDVAPILGVKGYNLTRPKVLHAKLTHAEPVINAFTQSLFEKGHAAEAAAREWAKLKLGFDFTPMVLESRTDPFLMTSLDGFDRERDTVLEAKYMGAEARKAVARREIKPHHAAQVQFHLMISGAKRCMYFAMDENGDAEAIAIYPDAIYQQRMLNECRRFRAEWLEAVKREEL
jgi:putative phage-type endonuclease